MKLQIGAEFDRLRRVQEEIRQAAAAMPDHDDLYFMIRKLLAGENLASSSASETAPAKRKRRQSARSK